MVMFYEFTDALKTGHATIDGEHKLIIEAANETLMQIARGATSEEILSALKIFSRYVKIHFPNEECLQEKFQYPNITFHKLWHRNYIKDIELNCSQILTKGVSESTINKLKIHIETLIQHIMLEDTNVAKHIQKCGEY